MTNEARPESSSVVCSSDLALHSYTAPMEFTDSSSDGSQPVTPPVIPLRNPRFTAREQVVDDLRTRLEDDGQSRQEKISNHVSVISEAQGLRRRIRSQGEPPPVWGNVPPRNREFTGRDFTDRAALLDESEDRLRRRLDRRLKSLIQFARQRLNTLLGFSNYELLDTIPLHETSPCGVIRLASPTVPRAPGYVRSHSTALAPAQHNVQAA